MVDFTYCICYGLLSLGVCIVAAYNEKVFLMLSKKYLIQILAPTICFVLLVETFFSSNVFARIHKNGGSVTNSSDDAEAGQPGMNLGDGEIAGKSDTLTPSDNAQDAALGTAADAVPRFALDQCISMALARNQRLKAAGYEVEAARGQLREVGATLWPVLEYQWRIAPVPTDVNDAFNRFFDGQLTLFNSIHVGLGFPLLTFGQLEMAKKMAQGGLEASRINEVKAHEGTIFQVKQLYYGLLLAKEMIGLLSDSVGKINNKIADEEGKLDGKMDPFDLMKLKVTKVDLERRLAESRQNLELAKEGLRIQMDLEPGEEFELDSDKLKPVLAKLGDEQSYIDAAMRFQPESKLLDVGVEVKRSQYKLEKFKLMPTAGFAFFADVGRTVGFVAGVTATGDYNDPFNYTRAGFGVQFKGNIDFHGAAGRIKKARAEYYKASYERLIAKRGLSLELRKAYLTAKRAQEDVARARKAESLARQMTFISKVNVDMGIGDNQKYGDALMLLLIQRGYYYKSIFDYNTALADLAQRVTLAKYEQITETPSAMEEYELFESMGDEVDEGFETYGVESESPPESKAAKDSRDILKGDIAPSHEPVLKEYMNEELRKDNKGVSDDVQ